MRRTGWTSIGIMPGTRTPGWAFSVGLWHSYRAPEVSLFGLLLPDMQQRVNRAGRLIRDNKPFGLDIEIDGILDAQPVVAKRVHPGWYPTLFGFAVGFYRGAVPPFVQLVWPDSHGLFPWQPRLRAAVPDGAAAAVAAAGAAPRGSLAEPALSRRRGCRSCLAASELCTLLPAEPLPSSRPWPRARPRPAPARLRRPAPRPATAARAAARPAPGQPAVGPGGQLVGDLLGLLAEQAHRVVRLRVRRRPTGRTSRRPRRAGR